VIWTAPTGLTYTTTPDGGFFFPELAVPTGDVIITPPTAPLSTARGLMMPARKRTRAQNRRSRIDHERRMNELRIGEERRKYEEWLATNRRPSNGPPVHRSDIAASPVHYRMARPKANPCVNIPLFGTLRGCAKVV